MTGFSAYASDPGPWRADTDLVAADFVSVVAAALSCCEFFLLRATAIASAVETGLGTEDDEDAEWAIRRLLAGSCTVGDVVMGAGGVSLTVGGGGGGGGGVGDGSLTGSRVGVVVDEPDDIGRPTTQGLGDRRGSYSSDVSDGQ